MRYIVLLILLAVAISPFGLKAQYKVMFSNNYPPYNYENEKGELVGFNVDILNAISALYDKDISISGNSWEAINKALENGDINAIGGAHYPGSPDNEYSYTRSAINTSHCFLYNSNYHSNFSLEFFRSLKEPLVGVWQNDVLNYYVLSINPTAKFTYVNNYKELVKELDNEDVTCIFGQRIGSMYYANKLGKDYVLPLSHRILERNMGFKVSNSSPELVELLNNGMEVILANGEYQRIYDKWINEYNKNHNKWQYYLKYILIVSILIVAIFLLLLILNWVLQLKVRSKTQDLQKQLEFNSQIMKELENQKIKAEESDKMKSAFLANMSHEIRTPMNGILGFTDLLKSADYSLEKKAHFIQIIKQSGNRMLGTINNIIDVSKLESGLEENQIKEVDINIMIGELYSFFKQEASSKGLNLTLSNDKPTTNHKFYTDEYKINSILTNLIKNALKFTKQGFIDIKYLVTDSFAEFWISDSGIGIAPDKQSTIFDHFVQANFSHSSGFEGSGLGLSISKEYVKLLNGDISLKSKLNNGTTFYVRIPNNVSDKIKKAEDHEQVVKQPEEAKKYKILIAEDDETSYYFLKIALSDIAETIIHAKDGVHAVEMAKKFADIDIILMDIKMPKLDGFEATKQIRKFNKKVYIIAQTAYAHEGYDKIVSEAGCDAYISKPIDKKKLLDIIQNINS